MTDLQNPDQEPVPEFEDRCMTIRWQWEGGELPFKDAIVQLNGLAQEAKDSGHMANQASVERVLGLIQMNRGNLSASMRHTEQAKVLFSKVGNRRLVAAMDMNLGEVYRYKGDFNRARQLYRAAYELAKETGFGAIQTIALANEGQLLLSMGKSEQARKSLEEAYRLSKDWTENLDHLPGLQCEIHHALAVIYLGKNEPDAAWEHAKKGLLLAQQQDQAMLLGFANRAMGEVLIALEKSPDEAFDSNPEPYYQAAIEAFRDINAEAEMARTMYAQAWSLAKQGKRSTAARKFQQVMIIFTKLGMVDDAARAAEAQLKVI